MTTPEMTLRKVELLERLGNSMDFNDDDLGHLHFALENLVSNTHWQQNLDQWDLSVA